MTSKSRRQAVILAALLVVLAAVLFVRQSPPPPGVVADTAANPLESPEGPGQPAVGDLRLEGLRDGHAQMLPPERNPFRFETRAQPAPRASFPAAPIVEPPVPSGPPPPPPIPLKFIGLLEGPARVGTIAILSDSRGNVFYGKEGDIIEGRYRVLRIDAESAEVAYVDGRGRQTIRLSGQ